MKVAILGFASQGKSAYEYWNKAGNDITICDSRETLNIPPNTSAKLGADYLSGLDEFDLIIRGAPSIHPKEIQEANPDFPNILDNVWSNTNEFFKVCPSKNIIGVTGTKGKGTTSSLIAKMIEASGKTVHLGGNIGTPPLDLLEKDIRPEDWVVLELANFQLIDLKFSPRVAVCLMVVPEHMDWHEDMDEYITAKKQLFKWQTVHDFAIYNIANAHSKEVVGESAAKKLTYEVPTPGAEPQSKNGAYLSGDSIYMGDTFVCKADEIALLGRHNIENVCAAITAAWGAISGDIDAIKKVISSFKGLEHRLELVKEIDGIEYYDDSFGTTPETAIVALQAFDKPKVVILGGSDKGASYEELAHVVTTLIVRKVVLIGEQASKIEEALTTAGYKDTIAGGDDMQSIVETAKKFAMPGDVVLLSTACASFDMFKNYKDRGDKFKKAVQALA